MDHFKKILEQLNKKDHDDDAIDRLNYSTTSKFLGVFAALIFAKQAVGNPLQCFIPAEYKAPWEKYIETYCFVENTYYVNSTLAQFPSHTEDRRYYELKYYQWMPYIFVLEAFICFVPKLIFKLLYSFAEMRVTDVIQYAWAKVKDARTKNKKGETAKPVEIDTFIASQLVDFQAFKIRPTKVAFGWYLTAIYLGMKLSMLASIFIQLLLLQFFIKAETPFWGFGLMSDLYYGRDWRVNGYFPRVTFCDLETRDLGQHRPHTIQCVLMLNMFIEKIYLFLWAWFLVTFAITVINILYWCFRIFSRGKKLSMINEALVQSGISDPRDRDAREIEYFIRHDLRYDGIVLLRLIDSNFGYINMSNVCKQLWESFKKTQE
jgi:hypothetical protein